MAKSIDEIATALMNTLYALFGEISGDNDPFVCWYKPGIPFDAEDFRFAKFMLHGQGANAEERTNDAALQLTQAAGFSSFVDFVPDANGVIGANMQGGILRPSSATLSKFYKNILEASQTAVLPEPAGINDRIQRLREQAKPMQAAYEEGQAAFEAARSSWRRRAQKHDFPKRLC
jgi:hypothetical protein